MTAGRRTGAGARAIAAFVITFVVTSASAGDAGAYVRERTDAGAPLAWNGTNCLPVVAYPRGFIDMTADEVGAAATNAAAAWSHDANACTYLTLTTMLSTDDSPVVIPQPHAAVVFRETVWCKIEADGTCSQKAKDNASYDRAVLMLTSTSVSTSTGQILEGATEVNAVDFRWADLALHPESGLRTKQDLQNGLTHELGHFIGLDHTCAPVGTTPWPVDDQGNPAPDCDHASASVRATTMYPSADSGDLSKRTLEADDVAGICGIYPVARDPGVCAPPAGITEAGGCTCAAAPAPLAGALPLLVLGLLVGFLVLARRRRDPRGPR